MDLSQNMILAIGKVAEKYADISRVKLFGSRARGDNRKGSDIDLAIFFGDRNYDCWLSFCEDIDELETLIKFDLVKVTETLNYKMRENIDKEGVVIWERQK